MRRVEKSGRKVCLAAFAVALPCLLAPRTAPGVDYTWGQGNTGGDWSTTTNWSPQGEPGGGGDSATLGDVTAGTRTVVYDASATGTVSTLTLVQTTAGATNELLFNRTAGVTSAITLGTAGGTEQITVRPADAATGSVIFTTPGGITLESGGVLNLGAVNPSGGTTVYRSDISGSVAINGGLLEIGTLRRLGTTTSSSQSQINFALSMTSGSINIANVAGSGTSDRRLLVIGNTTISGGAVTAGVAGCQFVMRGSTLQFEPDSFETDKILLSFDGNAQAMATDMVFNGLFRNTDTKTITSTLAGQNLGFMQISDGNSATPGSRTTFKLGSNLTLASGFNLPAASSLQTLESGRIDLGVDANTFTLDLSANSSVWTPTKSTAAGVTTAIWDLAGSGGTIIANGYDFTSTGVTANVGAGLTLESKAGGGVTNNLVGGTIAATSTFLYSGAATAGSPSTLASAATIGNVAVSSGALQLGSLGGIAGAATVSGGSLDLGGTTRTFANVTLTGGEITAGTLSTSTQTSLQAGTITAAIDGTGGFSKQGAGTVTLSAANTFSGNGFVQGGTLIVASNAALGDTVGTTRIDGGSTGAVLGLSGSITTAEPILMLMQGNPAPFSGLRNLSGNNRLTGPISLDAGGATWEVASDAGTLTIDGDITSVVTATDSWRTIGLDGPAAGVINGNIADGNTSKVNVTVRGGTWTIASNAAYTGQTVVDGGTLVVSGSLAGTSAMTVQAGGRLSGSGIIGTALAGAGLVSPGNSPGILTAAQVNPTSGLDYAFEFTATGSPTYNAPTASVNDVLRLTEGSTPFTTNLSAANLIDVYFDVASLTAGDTFKGGFYTDLAGDFSASIANATYAYWVKGNGAGSDTTFNGQGYYSLGTFDSSLSVTLSTVAEAADFGGGTINGQVTEFAVVPEPAPLALGGLAAAAALSLLARHRTRGV